jgi:hypothetical protein
MKINEPRRKLNLLEGVILDVGYACGCGFKDKDIRAAAAHVRETGHTIAGIHGEIRRDPRWVKEATGGVLCT